MTERATISVVPCIVHPGQFQVIKDGVLVTWKRKGLTMYCASKDEANSKADSLATESVMVVPCRTDKGQFCITINGEFYRENGEILHFMIRGQADAKVQELAPPRQRVQRCGDGKTGINSPHFCPDDHIQNARPELFCKKCKAILDTEAVNEGKTLCPKCSRLATDSKAEKFRKKPVVIEAMQFDGANVADILYWMGSCHQPDSPARMGFVRDRDFIIRTLESNEFIVSVQDWVIRGIKGEFYACKPDIFASTYESATVASTPAQAQAELETLKEWVRENVFPLDWKRWHTFSRRQIDAFCRCFSPLQRDATDEEYEILKSLAPAALTQPQAAQVQPSPQQFDKIVQQIAELPDRSSPEGWPEAMLVTEDELRMILWENLINTQPQAVVATPECLCDDTSIRGKSE